jgi:hypothetical protein
LVLAEPIESAAGWEMFPLLPETRQSGALLRETAVFCDVVSGANAEKDAQSGPAQAPRAK